MLVALELRSASPLTAAAAPCSSLHPLLLLSPRGAPQQRHLPREAKKAARSTLANKAAVKVYSQDPFIRVSPTPAVAAAGPFASAVAASASLAATAVVVVPAAAAPLPNLLPHRSETSYKPPAGPEVSPCSNTSSSVSFLLPAVVSSC